MADAFVTEHDGVLAVTFDRDAKLNAISPEMTAVLWSAVEAAATRDEIGALLIMARGRYFTAGIDLKAPTPATVARHDQEFRRLYREHHRLYDEIEALEKPVVLAAQGPCWGAGLEMAASCDFRLASTNANFRLPEVELGTIPGSGGVSRLTRIVGRHWAAWIAMAGRTVDAQQALQIGLVHQVLPAEGFHDAALAFAQELCRLPRQAVGATKLAIALSDRVDPSAARDVERLANTALVRGPEFQAGLERFRRRSGH